MREIVIDTETTGLSYKTGDRIIEVGCVELINHVATNKSLQFYCKVDKEISEGAQTYEVAEWAQSALDYIAMGDYPVESGYMLSGKGTLPAWPMKVVCNAMMVDDPNASNSTSLALLENLREAVSIYYNATKTEQCFTIGDPSPNDDTKATEDLWGYQYCSEMFMPMETTGGENDMYWLSSWNETNEFRYCRDAYDVQPRPYFAQETYGGRKMVENFASNIVFSNGMLDPWHLLGVLETSNPRVVLVKIDEGAHHNDLMFSSKNDPTSVKRARLLEVKEIQRWVDEARAMKKERFEAAFVSVAK